MTSTTNETEAARVRTAVLDDLAWRGLIAQSTDLDAIRGGLAAGPMTMYCGTDPTAASLHIGHLVPFLGLRRFQLAGHRPLALIGGATGLIGDPRPDAERVLNDPEVVAEWGERLRQQLEPILDFTGPGAAVVVNNLDWTREISAITFLRDIGKHFRVNQMLAKEAVSRRLESEQGISYTEFSYQIIQANDFLELYRRYGCRMQTAGTDQLGNITAGVDLVRRVEGAQVHALVSPLVTKSDGEKFGKTSSGAVWLDPAMTSPYAFYQFWVNQADADIGPLLRYYSFASHERIEELEEQTRAHPERREAQRALAEELTTLIHGETECVKVVHASQALFGRAELRDLDEATLAAATAELPSATVSASAIPPISELLAMTGLVESKSAGRRAVKEGGAYVNNRKQSADDVPETSDLLPGRLLVVRRGKRSLAVVHVA